MKKIVKDIRTVHRHTLEIVVAILVALLFIMLAKLAFGQQHISEKEVGKIAAGYANDKKNHALVIAVINGNNVQFFTYGEIERGSGGAPTAQSVFELGTVSCEFTTSLLSLFDAGGKAYLTDPLQNYFPQNVNIPVYRKVICTPAPEPLHYPTILNCYADPMYQPRDIVLCENLK